MRVSEIRVNQIRVNQGLGVGGIKIPFEHVDFWAKSLLFRTHHR